MTTSWLDMIIVRPAFFKAVCRPLSVAAGLIGATAKIARAFLVIDDDAIEGKLIQKIADLV